jgi:nucleoside-diphosphate-sugar epimerase
MNFTGYRDLPVLITGGAGFIGSHLVRGLFDAGARIRVLDNLATGSLENLEELSGKIDFIRGDITDLPECLSAMRSSTVVFHLAALGSVPGSVADPLKYNQVNIAGTLNVLEAARLSGVRRLVYSASSSAYGESPTLPKRENMIPAPQSPYAVGKLAGEHYARTYSVVYNLSTISLRYFNVFGPRQNPKSQYAAVIPAFISTLLNKRPPKIFGDGNQTRDFCFIDNVVRANMIAGIHAKELSGQSLNIACGQNISLNHMLAKMQKQLGTNIAPEYHPPRPGDVRDSLADISAARELIEYEPMVYFDQGLEQTVAWYARTIPA